MFLEILGTLEGFPAEVTFVWLQWDMNADVGSDVITLDSGSTARVPSTGQIQVVGALPSDMLLTDVVLDSVRSTSFRPDSG